MNLFYVWLNLGVVDSPIKFKLLVALNFIVLGKYNNVWFSILNATVCLNLGVITVNLPVVWLKITLSTSGLKSITLTLEVKSVYIP